MRFLHTERHSQANERAATNPRKKFDTAVYELGSLTHGNQSHPLMLLHWRKSHAMVFHFQHYIFGLVAQPHLSLGRFRMARYIRKSLLQNPIEVDGHIAVDISARPALLISYLDYVLLLKSGQVDVQRAF